VRSLPAQRAVLRGWPRRRRPRNENAAAARRARRYGGP
jgi:hypothetical protein